jgi:hypothetical protein
MNTRILLLAISAAALSSCSTMYKSGQTPDDVYYSPGQERVASTETNQDQYQEKKFTNQYTDMSDRYLRMKSSSQRWSAFDDDFMYWNNPTWNSQMMFNSWGNPYAGIGYSTGFGYGSWYGGIGYGSYWGNPYFMNPFCPIYYGQPVVIINPKPVGNPIANGPRTYNLNTYHRSPKSGNVYTDPKTGGTVYGTPSNPGRSGVRVFNNVNTGSGRSQEINYSGSGSSSKPRVGFLQSDNSRSRNSSSPTRTFESSGRNNSSSGSSSSGSRSSGGGGGSAPTRSFSRGGGN